jgi:hypothetical protein
MKLYLIMAKIKKIISILLFGGFGFIFIHSEANFLLHEEEDAQQHQLHDYCQIVKGAKIEKSNRTEIRFLSSFTIIRSDWFDHCSPNKNIIQSDLFRITKKFLDSPIYLSNKTFLI